ncbi:MAG TPA: hypothetical protein VJU83_12065 [Burkholderiales bacterium]|nr:hypothetical protein [Burkholderiales bacterium]
MSCCCATNKAKSAEPVEVKNEVDQEKAQTPSPPEQAKGGSCCGTAPVATSTQQTTGKGGCCG